MASTGVVRLSAWAVKRDSIPTSCAAFASNWSGVAFASPNMSAVPVSILPASST